MNALTSHEQGPLLRNTHIQYVAMHKDGSQAAVGAPISDIIYAF